MTATNFNTNYYQTSETVKQLQSQAVFGGIAAIPLLINPITGVLFGVIYAALTTTVAPLIDRVLNNYFDKSVTDQIKAIAIRFFLNIAIAAFCLTFLGFPISFAAAISLCVLMSLISILTKLYHDFRTTSLGPQASYTTDITADLTDE